MILSEKIKIKIGSPKQAKYYQKSGLKAELNEEIFVDVSLLPKGSHLNVEVACDICGDKKLIWYGTYNKQTNNNVEKYCCKKCNYIKIKQTKLKNYGDENYNNKEQYKKTCLKIYGIDNYSKTDVCKDDVKKTKLKNYGDEKYNNNDKSRITCLNKYGVEYATQNEQVKEKGRITNIERYGVISYSKTDEFKLRVLKTNLEKYGIENYSNSEKCKKTKFEKYGDKSFSNREKFKKTCLEKYGVEHPMHNIDIFKKVQKSCYRINKYKNIDYQGTYELDFLVIFYNLFKIERGPTVSYIFNNKDKKYYSDFYLPDYNLIVEIKSNYTYEVEKDKNECKKLSALENGYNFIFIIDKDYTNFSSVIESNNIYRHDDRI